MPGADDNEVSKTESLDLRADASKFEVVSEYNDWNANPAGEAFRNSLLSRGRTALEAGLGRNDELQLLPDQDGTAARSGSQATGRRKEVACRASGDCLPGKPDRNYHGHGVG